MGFLLPVMVLVAISHVMWLTHSTCYNSKSDVILKDHVIFSFSTDYLMDCWVVCENDCRCQSLNFFIKLHLCEINNRTIENRPQHAAKVPDTEYFSNPYYRVPKNCGEVLQNGCTQSGVYSIDPDGKGLFQVYCDQKTNGGGWTVFQRRLDGSVDFYRGWNDYKNGFGDLKGEFWLGLDKIYRLSNKTSNRLRVEIDDWEGASAYAEYVLFAVASEEDKYKLSLGTYSGTAGDSLGWHRGMYFSTTDSDNDKSSGNCAVDYRGAWWYSSCLHSNLNGVYYRNGIVSSDGVNWYHWKMNGYSYKRAEMKIRPV